MSNKSETIGKLSEALSKAQGEFKAAAFDATNPFLKNKYASLGSIIETAKPLMAKNGLSVSQLMVGSDQGMGITTILMHASGEWLEGTVMLPMGEEKGRSMAQSAGAIITYLRRYALASILGIYADDDEDGNKAGAQEKKKSEPSNGKPAQPVIYPEGVEKIVNSDGVRYIDIPSDKLSKMTTGIATGIVKAEKDQDELHRKELEAKRDAIKAILEARNG